MRVAEALDQDLGEADDRVHRRAQLVAHVRQELALQPVGLLDAAAGVLQLVAAPLQLFGQARQLGHLARLFGFELADDEPLLLQIGDAGQEEERRAEEEEHARERRAASRH